MPIIGKNNKSVPHVMIAGGGGFLGSYTALAFLAANWRVTTLGLGSAPNVMALGANHCEGLLHRDLFVSAADNYGNPDVIIHAAGGASVGQSWIDQEGDFEFTVGSTLEILEFTRLLNSKPHLVLVSSAAVYGNIDDKPLTESHTCEPVSPYGLHKLICEELVCGETRMRSLPTSIVRFFSLYGDGLRKQLLWDIMNRVSADPEKVLELWGDGDESRDFLHIEDAAKLLLLVSQQEVSEASIYNGATGENISVNNLAKHLINAGGWSTEINFNGKSRIGDPKHLRANVQKINTLGFKPEISLKRGIKQYADWFKHNVKRLQND